eukprot:225932_1
MSRVAEEDWSVRCIIENNVILFLLTSGTAISIPWFLYRYIKERAKKKKMTTTSPLYKGGLIYFVINLIWFIVSATANACFCSHSEFYVSLQFFNGMMYGIQYGALLLLLFMRCYYVFHGTAYQLSRCVVITYVALYIILVCSVMVSNFLYVTHKGDSIVHTITSPINYLAVISLNVILVYLFISKLLTIQKQANKANDDDEQHSRFMSTVMKATILTFMSILTTINCALIIAFVDEEGEYVFFIGLFLNFDVLTNYLSFLLGYSQFEANYLCLCGRCDKGFKSLCNMQTEVQMMANEVHSEEASPSADGTGVESNDIESK